MIETDSPYLAPVPFRGKKNEPSYLPQVGNLAAQLLSLTAEEFMNITERNTEIFFDNRSV